jgi:hypothetical protein
MAILLEQAKGQQDEGAHGKCHKSVRNGRGDCRIMGGGEWDEDGEDSQTEDEAICPENWVDDDK